jgi:hypothetical protein
VLPIQAADPWRFQYFSTIPCPAGVDIPTEDSDAWTWNPASTSFSAGANHITPSGEKISNSLPNWSFNGCLVLPMC